ncbi:zinc metallochaperone AztD [Saccharomonospora sp. NPDC046836]|uniref:zinc metallochaperone AztD n=1 Tax=Saccharomonospora sp. NPDC046836 TaxID=3156921 RepID=UPI0034062DAE
MTLSLRSRRAAGLSTAAAAVFALGACGSGEQEQAAREGGAEQGQSRATVTEPVVATYDGGIYVLDGSTLDVRADLALDGFNRLNPAGDDRHVLVSTSDGFRVLDATGATLTDVEFPGAEPGHVVRHAGRTVLFSDGTGEVLSFDPHQLGAGTPETASYTTSEPHHGVAVELENGELLVTLGNEEERTGIMVLDAGRNEIVRNEQCPGVHGEATARGETVVIGCEDGVLVYRDGVITKIDSPTEYGRIGNQSGTDSSSIVLGDYKQDKDAELERPTQVSLIDTETGALRLVDLGASYTFRSLARGPAGEALVLGTDGAIHVLDPVRGEVVRTIPVIGEWEEPLEWQEPRPALFVRGGTAFVSDPGERRLHSVDLGTGEKTATATLEQVPNEVSGVVAQNH